MKIVIALSDNYIATLKGWASVQRTLTEAQRLLEELSEEATTGRPTKLVLERIDDCIAELHDIGPAINHLHQSVREALWAQEKLNASVESPSPEKE